MKKSISLFWMTKYCLLLLLLCPLTSCGQITTQEKVKEKDDRSSKTKKITETKVFQEMNVSSNLPRKKGEIDTATFAAGCFWCVEAQFSQLEGVQKVTSGFEGGHTPNPTYFEVSTGTTGYAEACAIFYNPTIISYRELLAAFFIAHDPTQLNRQGHDIGTQYRSAIFYHNPHQKQLANHYIQRLNEIHAYPDKIVTQVSPSSRFYPAKELHQNYYFKNSNRPYCQIVIQPEMERFKKVFQEKWKENNKK